MVKEGGRRKRICIRFHMPGIFDSGWALRLLDTLRRQGEVEALLTGTTGTTALLDARMENDVKVIRERWSAWLKRNRGWDIAITATHTVDLERLKAECFHISRIVPWVPLIGIDTYSGVIVPWAPGTETFAEEVAAQLCFKIVAPKDYGRTVWIDGRGRECRRVLGVSEGDWILIDWLVVGKARSKEVVVVKENGKISEIIGGEVKEHGLEKLGDFDLGAAKIDTVRVLRGHVENRRAMKVEKLDRVALINHCGYDVYGFIERKISGAVTIGDDTTAIVGDILSRYAVPVIGITDGDADGLIEEPHYAKGSVILRVAKDDVFGGIVLDKIFGNQTLIDGKLGTIRERIVELARSSGALEEVLVPRSEG
jgi:hypothetical protein